MARYSVAAPEVISENFDGEMVLLDLRNGRYFGLNARAALIWEALVDGASPSEIDRMSPTEDTGSVQRFVSDLETFSLLIETDGEAQPLSAEAGKALGKIAGEPSIECYDDLAELILADPIHDTDEQVGWPRQRA